jgi:D-glycero-alpha-D-manno-heptose-7-phosphate kinase
MRIDLAGGWTDVPPYSTSVGGAVVGVAVSLYAHAVLRPREGGVQVHALDYGAAVWARTAEEIPERPEFILLRAAARRLGPAAGYELTTHSDAPAGSGLGGSGAMGVALVAAMSARLGERPLPAEVARLAHEIEVNDAGVRGGKQDQYTAALGGVQFLEFRDPSVSATRLAVPADALLELEHALVLCYTGASRLSGETHRKVWERYERGDERIRRALDGLRRCAHEMKDAVVAGDLMAVAGLLSRNWEHQKELADGMQTGAMSAMERAAAEAGAAGGKACGAGAGGCLVVLARPGRALAVAEALRRAGGQVLPFTIDRAGVTTWTTGEW